MFQGSQAKLVAVEKNESTHYCIITTKSKTDNKIEWKFIILAAVCSVSQCTAKPTLSRNFIVCAKASLA